MVYNFHAKVRPISSGIIYFNSLISSHRRCNKANAFNSPRRSPPRKLAFKIYKTPALGY
ncbi:MAG: hypothetical protein ACI4U9_03700 [Clostridia bacterium]